MRKQFTTTAPKVTTFSGFKDGLIFRLALMLLISISGLITNAQTAAQRNTIKQSVNGQRLGFISNMYNKLYLLEQNKIKQYLAAHPSAQISFVKNGSLFYLRRIDENGNPVYINTKNKASGELIKANELYSGGSLGANISGTGMIAGIWDGGQVRTTHELLSTHVAMEPGQTLDGSASNYTGNNHMTHVSGTMVGKDIANQPSARGIAYNATAKNYDWNNDKSEMAAFAASGYLISNHSYGNSNDNTTPTWLFGAYDAEASAWDVITKNAPNYLPFVAAGNEQQTSGNTTKAGYDIMTGSSAAKNVITVGAVNGDMTMSDYSNWGPTDDGRVKPDIVAKGTGINSSYFADAITHLPSDNSYSGNGAGSSGTSYASPAAAAAGLLLQQYYFSLYGTYMKASTLKGLMLATATDLGQPGPDPKFGWGLLNVEKAAKLIKYKTAAPNAGSSFNTNTSGLSYSYIEEVTYNPAANSSAEGSRDFVASGCEPLVVSFSWTDDEGPEQTSADGTDPSATRLSYDFDFMVRDLTTFTDVRPWKPVSMANRTANAGTCTTWFDVNYNNFKEVIIPNPVAGRSYRAYFRKKTGSPAAARIISVVASGLRVLPPAGSASQSFCSASTIANLVVTGSNVKWYDAATAGNLLPSTTALVTGTTYYASQTIEGCESVTRLAVTVASGSVAAPAGNSPQSFCSASTIANLVVTGTNIKWYDAATAGNLLASTTTLVNGTTYYASQTTGTCESAIRLAVTVSLTITAAPTGSTTQNFCSASTVANLTATGTNIKWYDAATAGNLLASTTALVTGTTYYASQTSGSCESTTRLAVTATIGSAAAPTGTAAQSFCNSATVANLTATGTNIKWYDAATAGNLLASTTALVNGTTYYASQTVGSCESTTRFAVTVTINVTAAPTGTASQSFCNAATIANLTVTGSNIKWYNAATAGTLLASTTPLTNGSIYYASQTTGTCESATRFAVTVTLNVTVAPTGSTAQNFCNSATVANLVATGTNIKWYDAATAGNLLASTTALVNSSAYYASQTTGTCESATRLAVTATITAPAAPAGVAAQTFCAAATVNNLVVTGTNIKWYDAATAGNLLASTTALVSGTTYYASQTTGTCESATRLAVTATVTIAATPAGNAIQNFCAVSTVANLTATGTNIKWYDAATAGNLLPAGTLLISGNTYYASQTIGSCESAGRFAVTVTITTPAIKLIAAPYSVLTPAQSTTLTATVSPVLAGNIYTWFRNGNLVSGATGNIIKPVTVDDLGVYTVKVTTATGCAVTSAPVAITESVSDKLFIAPNPSKGVFKIRYYSTTPNYGTVRMLSIYSGNGSRIYTKTVTITSAYSSMDVDITKYGRGIYLVIVADAKGKKLASSKLEVL